MVSYHCHIWLATIAQVWLVAIYRYIAILSIAYDSGVWQHVARLACDVWVLEVKNNNYHCRNE